MFTPIGGMSVPNKEKWQKFRRKNRVFGVEFTLPPVNSFLRWGILVLITPNLPCKIFTPFLFFLKCYYCLRLFDLLILNSCFYVLPKNKTPVPKIFNGYQVWLQELHGFWINFPLILLLPSHSFAMVRLIPKPDKFICHTLIFYKNQHNLRTKAFFSLKKQNKNQKRLYFFVKNHFAT